MNANKNMKKDDSSSFQTVWKVGAGGEIRFRTIGSHTIDWGDGCTEQVNTEEGNGDLNKHTYVKKGEYTVTISPGVTQFWLTEKSAQGTAEKLIEIKQWGTARWKTMEYMFAGARSMIYTATDTPDLSKVEDMSFVFSGCRKFNTPIEHWDTKGVKKMSGMLRNARMFNQPLANMDLKAIEYVAIMLEYTPALNQDLRGLNIGSKVNTNDMFGWDKSLAQYNLEHAERYAAQEEKQDVYNVLDG